VGAAHCAYFLSVAETAAPHLTGPDQGTWLARLDADQANLRRAAEHAARRPDGTEQVLRLSAALKRYWITHGRNKETLTLLLPVLDRPDARANPELFGTALAAATLVACFDRITAARRLGEQAVKLARELDAGRLLIESLTAFSLFWAKAGEPEWGLPLAQETIEHARRLGDDVLLGESLTRYLTWYARFDPEHAGPLFTEAIACTQRSGDHMFAYYLNNSAAIHALRAGDISVARAHLQEAAQAMRAIGDEDSLLPINMGWALRQDGDPDGARSSFNTALRIDRRRGERFGIAYETLGLGCLAADAGSWHRAAVLHGAAQAILDAMGQPWEELEANYRRESLDQVRAQLGQQQFKRAYAQGMALSSDEAFELASGRVG